MVASQKGISSDTGEAQTPEQQLTKLARLLDVPVEDVVDAVGALMDFNDHASAQAIRDELDQRDADDRVDSMARALLSDIESAQKMLCGGMDSSDLKLLFAALRDRVIRRLG